MARFQFARAGAWDYPALGLVGCQTNDVIDTTSAPDAFWTSVAGGTPVTKTPIAGFVGTAYTERANGSVDVYDDVANTFVPTVLASSFVPRGTKTSRFGFGGVNATNNTITDILHRVPVSLSVTTSRWRLHYRNVDAKTPTLYTGALSSTGAYVGLHLLDATGAHTGNFTAAPVMALPPFVMASDASEYVSGWVTDPAAQFTAGAQNLVSIGLTGAGGQVWAKSVNAVKFKSGGGSAAQVASQTIASFTGISGFFGDGWIEYEYLGTEPVGLFLGDSLTDGQAGTLGMVGAAGTVYGRRARTAAVAAGLSGYTAQGYAGHAGSDYLYSKWGLGSGWIPDYAVVFLGTNDLAASRTAVQVETDLLTIYAQLRTFGIKRLYGATITPRGWTGALETARTDLNAWLRALPGGLEDCFDFDRAVRASTDATILDPIYNSGDSLHLSAAGYSACARAVSTIA